MTWGNPPKFIPTVVPKGRKITPEALAKSGSEDGHQMALFAWAADNIATYPQLAWLFAIPNGGSRHIAEATKMVATGLRRGVPDVFLPWPTKNFAGLWIEMKVGKNKINKDQNEWLQYLSSVGYMTSVQWSWVGARDIIIDYLERA